MSILKLADGTEFNLSTKQVVEEEAHTVEDEPASSFTPAPVADVRLSDLPADPKTVTVVNAILGYRFIGMPDRDIAEALGCTHQQLYELTNSDAYQKMHDMILASFVKGQQNAAKDIIAASATDAAKELTRIMRTSKSESNRLKASGDLLNRAGISDTGHTDPMGGGLIIKMVKDTKADISIKVG